ncbi:uncharacterized protein F4822DRAFT_440124 [Hypoxylon trugodes]|uniref:uncharacterized protein n=1 Tax=Hypoxylon trugodes TaxID=326681 RepID=UPI00218FDBA3|nr:uncharacterized protein F4822DRAFT_440124 [Hypoxylon trugodes]KAI1383879.1 hypothetical protein F4822DRAFT_440124 [Hypoxylon trugodes]
MFDPLRLASLIQYPNEGLGLLSLPLGELVSSIPGAYQLAALLGLYMWDSIDGSHSKKYGQRYCPFPLPEPNNAHNYASDVSIIVPTIDWDDELPGNLLTWLACRPQEVIFVTVEKEVDRLESTLKKDTRVGLVVKQLGTVIKVASVQEPNKRSQLCCGINHAKGKILCLVDDDARWTTTNVLAQLLAPFENEDVGLVGGPIGSYVPTDRQHPDVITPWEVAALRIRSKREPGMKAFFMADRSTNFTVSGLTMLLRAEIVKDPYFQFLFTHDMFNGVRQNTGDDGFITRYILFQHQLKHREYSTLPRKQWRLGMQLHQDAEVQTSILTDHQFASQSKRWYRSGLRLRLTCLLYEPGFRGMRAIAPHMARKMSGGMMTPFFAALRLYLWISLWMAAPQSAFPLLLWVLYNWYGSLQGFMKQYPYCSSKIWAAMIADNLYLISDIYSWLTLSQESWSNRESGQAPNPSQNPQNLRNPQSQNTQTHPYAQHQMSQSSQSTLCSQGQTDSGDRTGWNSAETLVPLMPAQSTQPEQRKERGCKHVKPTPPPKEKKVHKNHPHLGAIGDAIKDFTKEYEDAYWKRKHMKF